MAIKCITSLPSVAWAVPPSPARDKHACFRALADQQLGSATAGLNSDNKYQKVCANLCMIVQNNIYKIKVIYGAQA